MRTTTERLQPYEYTQEQQSTPFAHVVALWLGAAAVLFLAGGVAA